MIDLKTSLAVVSVVPIKIMTTLLLSTFKSLCTTCKQFMLSPNYNSAPLLIIVFHLIVIVLILLHRFNSKHGAVHAPAPLLSFPSLSLASISLAQPLASLRSIPRPLASFPSLPLQAIFGNLPFKKDPHVIIPVPETVVVPSAPPEPERYSYDDIIAPDEEGMSMEDTWKAIFARGDVAPIKLKHTDTQDDTLETVVRKVKEKSSGAVERKKKKEEKRLKRMEQEQRSEGLRQRDAMVTPHDDLSRQADAFIKKQKDHLKLQKEEADKRRQLRLECNEYQNPF